MSIWLLSVVTVLYLATGIAYFWESNPGMSLAFFAYALANVGFIWANLK